MKTDKSFAVLMLIMFLVFSITPKILIADEVSIAISDDNEVVVERYIAKDDYLIIWMVPEYGFRKAHRLFAKRLANAGIEVWQLNMPEALFEPLGVSSIKSLDGRYMADVIEQASIITGKKILVMGDSYGALAALKAAHAWQRKEERHAIFIGGILFSPYTYSVIPPLGLPPEYMPVVSATNIPLLIYQAKDSGTIGQFDLLMEKLQKNGSPIYTRFVPEVMSLFYNEIPTKAMLKHAEPLPDNIVKMISLLEKHKVPLTPVAFAPLNESRSGIDLKLKEYLGHHQPVAIVLTDVDDNKLVKNDFKGQVTVINFWATWCGPCIEEIPSLNRLMRSMQDIPFELISINYAEEKQEVIEFMKMVNVEFPVLMDYNGEYAKQWKVVTYPSTFLIGLDGEIKYGVNAAIEWDAPEVRQIIREMLIP